jgi:hypothetical protein
MISLIIKSFLLMSSDDLVGLAQRIPDVGKPSTVADDLAFAIRFWTRDQHS